LFKLAKTSSTSISLDPGWDPKEKWNGPLKPALDQIDIFLPNEQEAMKITSTSTISAALQNLGRHMLLPVIKMGEKGACTIGDRGKITFPGFEVKSIDTTGAGDSFNAGFLYGYLNGLDLEDCLRWGCACGALSTMQIGGIKGQPTAETVEHFLSGN